MTKPTKEQAIGTPDKWEILEEIQGFKMTSKNIKTRLEYLRHEIEAERISYGEIAELQSLAQYIDPSDTLLLQWAGVEENN